MSDLYHYCVLRNDLPLGVFSAQLIHIAGESNPGGKHSYAVALYARDEEHLASIEAKLIEKEILHVSVREIDSPYFGALMGIGIVPFDRTTNKPARRIVAGLKLIKEKENEH